MARQHAPSEILAAVIGLTGTETIPADAERLQRAVYVARDMSPLLRVFVFSEYGAYPYSRILDDALARLKLSRVVRMENTDYKNFLLSEEARKWISNEILSSFDDAERDSLRKVATVVGDAWRAGA